MKTRLLGKTPEELKEIAVEAGLPAFAGKQMAQWLYQKRVKSIEEMTNLSKQGREALSQRYEVGMIAPIDVQTSQDGTRKYLFPVQCQVGSQVENSCVEAVMIPDEDRKTLCVSSQAGCKMACKFCMTGRQGFHGNLDAADILSQYFAIEEAGELTNTVFMGMGEPLDNWENVKRVIEILTAPWGLAWSPKRITLSTIGVLPNLKRFLDESKCHLAVSLHNPFPEEREQMMPVQKAWSETEVVRLIKQYDFTGQRRVSFEYTVFHGWNDTPRHAEELVRLLRHLECRV
ncbi:MAG: radical SAM protein, partial [Bacteroidales bacterium]|nr:radical SAM protein [Bacteroidales bacterium]